MKGSSDGQRAEPLRILFVLRALNLDRVFEHALRALLARGHAVEVVLEREKQGLPPGAGSVFAALRSEYPTFSWEQLPSVPPTAGERRATELRLGLDYARYLGPAYADAPALRARARRNAPERLARVVERNGPGSALVARGLRELESRLPVPEHTSELVRSRAPDVVIVAPLVELGSAQVDVVRAAAELGIPSVLLVASWDNLTNKGLIKEVPTATIVWNDPQIEEAVRLHRLPRDRIAAVGAHTFDHWFDWRPSTDAESFAAKVGLDPGRPFFLYTCSSTFVAREEVAFVEEWVTRIRASDDAVLADVGIVVRPHPQVSAGWSELAVREPGRTVVWPEVGETPADDRRKRDYFDSLWHARAVVGVNTSALVEAAIVRRPAYTVVTDRFRATQEGTLHFAHLAGDGDGVLSVAHSWPEHLQQLGRALRNPDERAVEIERFLTTFVRPRGLDVPAASLLAAAVEDVAGAPTRRRRRSGVVGALWPAVPRILDGIESARRGRLRVRRAVSARRARPAR